MWINCGVYAGGGARTRTAMGQGILSALCLPIPSRPRQRQPITPVLALAKGCRQREMRASFCIKPATFVECRQRTVMQTAADVIGAVPLFERLDADLQHKIETLARVVTA